MIGIHVRIENSVNQEIEQMAKARGITPSQVVRELIDIGIKVKKHMENKKPGPQEAPQISNQHLEVGASSAIEALLLLRKMLKDTNPEWLKEAHEETIERVNKLSE